MTTRCRRQRSSVRWIHCLLPTNTHFCGSATPIAAQLRLGAGPTG
jgi:hypothetical protein